MCVWCASWSDVDTEIRKLCHKIIFYMVMRLPIIIFAAARYLAAVSVWAVCVHALSAIFRPRRCEQHSWLLKSWEYRSWRWNLELESESRVLFDEHHLQICKALINPIRCVVWKHEIVLWCLQVAARERVPRGYSGWVHIEITWVDNIAKISKWSRCQIRTQSEVNSNHARGAIISPRLIGY